LQTNQEDWKSVQLIAKGIKRMLSITRDLKKNTVVIGEDITVRVVAISGNQVKLAIEAPKDCKILRSELLDNQEKSA